MTLFCGGCIGPATDDIVLLVGGVQALPLVTVIVGARNEGGKLFRIETTANNADEPRYTEFNAAFNGARLQPGKPLWANYVKGRHRLLPSRHRSD